MTYIAPNTRVRLLRNINIPSDGKHTLYFASLSDQKTFFESAAGVTFTNYSFQRGTNGTDRIRVGASYGSLYGCSYMLFNNESFLDKNFYAFILDIKYINNETCEITYRIDNLQTWLFDITLLPSYVERTMDDGTGQGLETDEGLSPGDMEMMYDSMVEIDSFDTIDIIEDQGRVVVSAEFCVIIQATCNIEKADFLGYPQPNADLNDYHLTSIYTHEGNMIDAIGTFCVPLNNASGDLSHSTDPFLNVYNWIQRNGFGDSIIQMWVYPMSFINYTDTTSGQTWPFSRPKEVWTVTGVRTDTNIIDASLATIPIDQNNQRTCNGIVPKNEKLFRYPFTQLMISNNNGSGVAWRFEDFTVPDSPTARLLATTTAESKVRLVPQNYGQGAVSNKYDTSFAIDSAPLPSVSYVNDYYAVWLAQNRNTINNNFDQSRRDYLRQEVMSFGKSAGRILTDNFIPSIGTVGAGAMDMSMKTEAAIDNLRNIVANAEDMRNRPATASGVQSVGLATQNGKAYFTSGVVQPRIDRVKQLDDYFTMFGYKQDKIMPLNLHIRQNFTYIKTAGCMIRSNIPKDIESAIAAQFDSGIWFWVDNSNMCDFSVSNNVLI